MLVPFDVADTAEEQWSADSVRQQFVLWGRPSTGIFSGPAEQRPAQDMRRVSRLCTVATRFMDRRQNQFLQEHRNVPVLMHYQSDATSYLTRFRQVLGTQQTGFSQRGGHDLCEFLSERLFLASVRGLARGSSQVVIRPPRLLRCGKKASNHITAMREHVPLPFASGCQLSFVLTSVCFDRAVFDACHRLIQQQHLRFWSGPGAALYHDSHVHRQLDIVVGTGCALHDVATGLRWATKPYLDKEDAKILYLAVEGLRKGIRYLFKILPAFLLQCVAFDMGDDDLPDAVTAEFWRTLGISDDMLSEFVALQPRSFQKNNHPKNCDRSLVWIFFKMFFFRKLLAIFLRLFNLFTV